MPTMDENVAGILQKAQEVYDGIEQKAEDKISRVYAAVIARDELWPIHQELIIMGRLEEAEKVIALDNEICNKYLFVRG